MFTPGVFVAAASFALAGILISAVRWGKRKANGDRHPIVIGAVAFILFALFCENIFHQILFFLFPGIDELITGNLFLYVFYGCAMAGVFEEGGRYYAFSRVIPGYDKPGAAAAYGAGHGGIELVLSGILGLLLMAPAAFGPWEAVFWVFERTVALLGHVALSIVVFTGVRLGKRTYVAGAIVLHMLADVPIGLYRYGVISLRVCDAAFASAVLLCGFMAAWCQRRLISASRSGDPEKGQQRNESPQSRIFNGQS